MKRDEFKTTFKLFISVALLISVSLLVHRISVQEEIIRKQEEMIRKMFYMRRDTVVIYNPMKSDTATHFFY